MKRRADIQALLEECSANILAIERKYDFARSDDLQLEVLKPLVKSTMEHLRSVLEYTAQDIWESYTKKKNTPYFPYGKDEESFVKSLSKNLPGLAQQRPDLLAVVESIQPHNCGDSWVSDLCSHTNFNKHNRLKPQVRKNSPSNTINIGGGLITIRDSSDINLSGTIDGALISALPVSLSNSMPAHELREKINSAIDVMKEYDWVEFHFEGSISDVHKFLILSRRNVEQYVEDLEPLI
jgi:hypothetical protein